MTQHQPSDGLSDLSAMFGGGGSYQSIPPTPEDPARAKRRRRTRRIVGLVAAGLVAALVVTYVSLTLTAPIGAAAASVERPTVAVPAAATIALPKEGEAALSISGGDAYLGSTADGIFASSGDSPMPMASISKLITAMVVLQAKPLGASGNGATITFDKADHDLYDKYYLLNATIAAMPTGSSMSEHDAIETMLVVSACNYAEAVADWAFGSNAAFLSATRRWLAANGMTHTVMVEPTGIDAKNTSTPSDLITLGKLAMANPAIAAIVAKTSLDNIPSLSGMPNTNDLLGVDGVDGIKTGTLGGSDLLFSAVINPGTPTPLTLTGVELGGESRGSVDDDVRALISSISAGFHQDQLATEGEPVGTYSTPWGAKATMALGKDASVLTWSNTPITSTMKTTTLKTGASGEKVGSVTWVAGKTTVTVPVVLQGKIRGPSVWWRLTHPFQLMGK